VLTDTRTARRDNKWCARLGNESCMILASPYVKQWAKPGCKLSQFAHSECSRSLPRVVIHRKMERMDPEKSGGPRYVDSSVHVAVRNETGLKVAQRTANPLR